MNKETKQKTTKKKKTRKIFKFIRVTILFMLLLVLSFSTYFYLSYRQEFSAIRKEAVDKIASINDNTFRKVGPTIIYDDSGKEISKLAATDYIYTKVEDIPQLMKDAFVATEDKDFYKNSGISFKGIARAFAAVLKNDGKITQGGSTITQQLVKNVLLTQAVTWQRKVTEVLISLQLNKVYTKQ